MSDSFRAVFDPPGQPPVAVRVIGHREPFTEGVRSPAGMGDWFLAVFHDPVPVLEATGWRTVPAESLVINPPGTPIGHGETGGGFRRSWLRGSGSAIARLVAEAGLPSARAVAVAEAGLHERWLLALREECQHPRGANARSVEALLGCWLRAVARAAETIAAADSGLAAAAKREIDGSYLEPLGLERIARRLGVSRTGLCRAFRAAYDTSPMAYLRQLRLARAEDLLLGTDLPIGEIAERCAYRDIYYFSRAFRASHGCTPSAFRRR